MTAEDLIRVLLDLDQQCLTSRPSPWGRAAKLVAHLAEANAEVDRLRSDRDAVIAHCLVWGDGPTMGAVTGFRTAEVNGGTGLLPVIEWFSSPSDAVAAVRKAAGLAAECPGLAATLDAYGAGEGADRA